MYNYSQSHFSSTTQRTNETVSLFGHAELPRAGGKPHGTGGRVNKQLKRSNGQNEVKLTAWRSGAIEVIPPRKMNQIYLGYSTL